MHKFITLVSISAMLFSPLSAPTILSNEDGDQTDISITDVNGSEIFTVDSEEIIEPPIYYGTGRSMGEDPLTKTLIHLFKPVFEPSNNDVVVFDYNDNDITEYIFSFKESYDKKDIKVLEELASEVKSVSSFEKELETNPFQIGPKRPLKGYHTFSVNYVPTGLWLGTVTTTVTSAYFNTDSPDTYGKLTWYSSPTFPSQDKYKLFVYAHLAPWFNYQSGSNYYYITTEFCYGHRLPGTTKDWQFINNHLNTYSWKLTPQ